MQPILKKAIYLANHYWGPGKRCANYGLLCEYNLGEIMRREIENDPAHGIECIYLVTDESLERPIYIGSTIRGAQRIDDHIRSYYPTQFGSILTALGSECYPWTVSFIHSSLHRYGNFRRDETHLIIKFRPYIYGMSYNPSHNEKPEFLKRYEARFWTPERPDPIEMQMRAVRAAFGE